MLIGAPLSEAREVVEDALAVRVEDVGAVVVDQYACRICCIVGVAGDVGAAVDYEYLLAGFGKFAGDD